MFTCDSFGLLQMWLIVQKFIFFCGEKTLNYYECNEHSAHVIGGVWVFLYVTVTNRKQWQSV